MFSLIWKVAGVAGCVLIVSGFFLSLSGSFKEECAIHKASGMSIGWFKDAVCDLDFTTKNGN